MNNLSMSGNIGSEPKVTVFASGRKVARFSVAINTYSKDKDKKPAPTWVPCELWEEVADRILQCKEKAPLTGRFIELTGSLSLNVYTEQIGLEQRTVNKLFVKVHNFRLIGGLKDEDQGEPLPEEIIELWETGG